MRGFFRVQSANWLFGGIHLFLAAVAAETESREGWAVALALMAVVSFFAWIGNWRRLRQITDTPTSKVATAAQGYAELAGRAQPAGAPIAAPYSGLPCCWYRYFVEKKRSDGKWRTEDSGESDTPFFLVDETGRCRITPEGAEIHCEPRDVMTRGDHRYTEWRLRPGDRLYAIGTFSTTSNVPTPRDVSRDVSALLSDWKADRKSLLERFDLDGDGTIGMKEWELAHRAARREIEKRHAQTVNVEGDHCLGKPDDGRPFLISNQLPDRLAAMYRRWTVAHLVLFFGTGIGAIMLSGPV